MERKTEIELLAPARDVNIAISAIKHGADAVYIGANSHGARSAAGNSIEDICGLVDFAHKFDVKVYVTVNTLVYDNEIHQVEALIRDLYRIGVDALIVQDLGILRMDIPPIELHASTQCDIRTPEKALFLAGCGFTQLVLPREFSIEQTAAVRRVLPPDVRLEAFVHGALCVSYSGDCQAGFVTSGRSANRGECPQICRLAYDLEDMQGRKLAEHKYLLSLRDLNRTAYLHQMISAGITSFKIEGRLKDESYVKNVTAHYSGQLNELIAADPTLSRSSSGASHIAFKPDVDKCFNRGFTSYFTDGSGSRQLPSMVSLTSPKWCGRPIGTVVSVKGNVVTAKFRDPVSNGDGLGYVDDAGHFCGFRVNRADGNTVIAASEPVGLRRGMILTRNRDKAFDDCMNGDTAIRTIDVDLTLNRTPDGVLSLSGSDCRGNMVTVVDSVPSDEARTDQSDSHRRALVKTGATIYNVRSLVDNAGDRFVPLSRLTDLRRRLTDGLTSAQSMRYKYGVRRKESPDVRTPESTTYHDNIANHLASSFYNEHGTADITPALESAMPKDGELCVMTTRYCLRAELGQCMLNDAKRTFPDGPLILRASDSTRPCMRVEFNCSHCGMKLYTTPQ